jgi:hypothetical protein
MHGRPNLHGREAKLAVCLLEQLAYVDDATFGKRGKLCLQPGAGVRNRPRRPFYLCKPCPQRSGLLP